MDLLIYGNGAMAKVLFSYVKKKMKVAGFTVDDHCIKKGTGTFCGLPLVPFSRVQEVFDPQSHSVIIAVGYLEMNELRGRKYLEAKKKGYTPLSFIHESVLIHDDVSIGDNCIIFENVSIHPGSKIGHGTFISSNVSIGHDCIIDSDNWINSGISLAGGCHIGSGCFFGVNSSLADGVVLGKKNFIGANTLVNKNTKDNEVHLSEAGQIFPMTSKPFLKFIQKKDQKKS